VANAERFVIEEELQPVLHLRQGHFRYAKRARGRERETNEIEQSHGGANTIPRRDVMEKTAEAERRAISDTAAWSYGSGEREACIAAETDGL